MNVASPQCTSTEFVYRNSLLSGLNGTNSGGGQFVVFPAREMGQNNHANQFNFGITDTSQYKDTFTDSTQDDNAICAAVNNPSAQWQFSNLGTDNIAAVQASGYPVAGQPSRCHRHGRRRHQHKRVRRRRRRGADGSGLQQSVRHLRPATPGIRS